MRHAAGEHAIERRVAERQLQRVRRHADVPPRIQAGHGIAECVMVQVHADRRSRRRCTPAAELKHTSCARDSGPVHSRVPYRARSEKLRAPRRYDNVTLTPIGLRNGDFQGAAMHDSAGPVGGGAPAPHVSHTPHVDYVPHHHHGHSPDNWGTAGAADPRQGQHNAFAQRGLSRRGSRARTLLAVLAAILILALFLGAAVG